MTRRLILIIITFLLVVQIVSAQSDDTHGLVLRGKVLKTWTDRSQNGFVDLMIDLNLDFANAGPTPLIMLRPWDDRGFWHGGSLLATTLQNAESNNYIFNDGMWQSITRDDADRKLAVDLDQPLPPPGLTRILKPGESWNWRTTVAVRFEERTHWRYPGLPTWEEMKTQSSPLWLRVSFEMWPFNTEFFKPNLAAKLQKRWRRIGSMWIGEKDGRIHLARLASAPIELDWQAALAH